MHFEIVWTHIIADLNCICLNFKLDLSFYNSSLQIASTFLLFNIFSNLKELLKHYPFADPLNLSYRFHYLKVKGNQFLADQKFLPNWFTYKI